jgi:hypothetical protein
MKIDRALGRATSLRNFTVLLMAAAAPIFAAAAANAADREIGAVIQRDYRDAAALPANGAALRAIRFQDKVFALDTVVTGAAGTTSLQFLDETRIDVGPGAEVLLDSFIYDPASTAGAGEMSFAVGAFRYVGGRMTTEENVRLKTPTATMVIRGTELVIYVWPDGRTEVNVVSGAVEVSACGASGGGSQMAMTGMQVTVLPSCVTQVAPVRTLPPGFAALDLPNAAEDRGEGGDDDPDDRGDGRDRDAPDRGGEGGGSQNGGGRAGIKG